MINGNENEAQNENILHRYDINRSRPRDRQTYSKYKICLSTMLVICIKQDLKLSSRNS